MANPRFTIENTVLLVVDFQQRLLPTIDERERVVDRAGVLIDGCRVLGVPIIVTEQYPEGLGPTVEAIRSKLDPDQPIDQKLKFSAAVARVRQRLEEMGRSHVVICGVETHVCVLQTALDLSGSGYVVAIAEDAVGARRPLDHTTALHRLRQLGAIPTTCESALLEMVHEAGTDIFKSILPLIR